MHRLIIFAALASVAGGAVAAQSGIDIQRSVFLERAEREGKRVVRQLEPAALLRKGDSVVLMLQWTAPGRDDSFTVSSRIPRDLAFQRSGGRTPEFSVDGGRSWGKLENLRIDTRRASPEDVTHLRWEVSDSDAAIGRGIFSYSAIVR